MKDHLGKIMVTGVVALLLLAVGFRFWSADSPGQSSAREDGGSVAAVAVQVSAIERRDLQETRSFTGTLEAESRFDVTARLSGRLVSLGVDIGDRVQRGQVLARLDEDEFVQQFRQAEAEVEMAEANWAETESALLVARREFERVQALRQREIASEAELDATSAQMQTAEARVKVARATVAQRRAALEMESLRLSYTKVRAIWEAEGDERAVAERYATEGAIVAANEPLFTLVDLRRLRGVIFVAERDFPLVRRGQTANVTGDTVPGRSFPARVARIAPIFQAGSRQARVEVEVMNEDELLSPGMFARIHLQLRESTDAIAVPADSVVRRDGKEGVFLIDEENRVRFIAVERGIRDEAFIEILAPVIDGQVVTLGQNQLTDGAQVRIITSGAGSSTRAAGLR